MVKIAHIAAAIMFACSLPAIAGTESAKVNEAAGDHKMAAKKVTSKGPEASSSSREEKGWVYHLSQAQWHANSLRESTMIKVAQAIEERGWNQTQAAKFLGVSQPRISDLMRGQTQKFTLDALVEMLYALDKPVTLVFDKSAAWGLSNYSPKTNQELEDKIAYYTVLIKQSPKDIQAYRKRAEAYYRLQKYDLAIGDYTKCIELKPAEYGTKQARAMAYSDSGQYQAALHDCDDLLRDFPNENVYQNRALIYMSMNNYDKALADATKAVEIDPQRPGPWWNRAMIYEKTGKLKEAIADYKSTLKADPTYAVAQNKINELQKKLKGA